MNTSTSTWTLDAGLAAFSSLWTLMHAKLSQAGVRAAAFGLSTFLSMIFAYLISIIVFRVWFHPLAKYPGPLLCKLTTLVWSYHFCKGSILQWEFEQHRKYGDVIRLGPNRLSYIDPGAWKDIYGHGRGGAKENVKNLDRANRKLPPGRLPMSVEPTEVGHQAQRKQFNPAFSDRALREQENLLKKYIDHLARNMREAIEASSSGAAEVDVARLYDFLAFDVMGHLTFGEGLDQLETGVESSWVEAVYVVRGLLNKKSVFKTFPFGGFIFDLFAPRGIMQKSATHVEHCKTLVARRLERGNNGGPDILGVLIRQPDEVRMSQELMNLNAYVLMASGTETTGTTLMNITYLLVNNPDKMERLVHEIRSVPDRSNLDSNYLARMTYLNAVIDEALRLFPIGQVGLGTQREIADGGNWVCGDFLAEGTEVAVAAWSICNSPRHWKDPAKFVPERWIPEETEYSEYHEYDKRLAWLAFGTGPRVCIGQNLALQEIRGVLGRVLYDFDVAKTPKTVDWLQIKKRSIWEKPKLYVRLTLRNQG